MPFTYFVDKQGEGGSNFQNLVYVVCVWPLKQNLFYAEMKSAITHKQKIKKIIDCSKIESQNVASPVLN